MKKFDLEKEPKIIAGFSTPENYFENFEIILLRKLTVAEPKVIPFFSRNKIYFYAAAAVLVFALILPIKNLYFHPTPQPDLLTLENYLANREEISNEDIAELLQVEDLQKIKIHSDIEDQAIEDLLVRNVNLEEYINDNEL